MMDGLKYMFLAAVVFSTAACRMTPTEETPAEEGPRTVQFSAAMPTTRAAFLEPEGGVYPVVWQSLDQVKLLLNNNEITKTADKGVAYVSLSDDGRSGSFSVSVPDQGDVESLNFSVYYPASAYAGRGEAGGSTLLTLPSTQKSSLLSVDPAAMLLSAFAGPYGSIPERIDLRFSHLTAYGCISLTGLPEGETLQSLTLQSDRPVAGLCAAEPIAGTLTIVDGTDRITVASRDAQAVWFACVPGDWSGSTLELTAVTTGGSYTATRTLEEGREMKAGYIVHIPVDMGVPPGKSDVFDENNIAFSFGAISDTHITGTTNAYAQKFTAALRQLRDRAAAKDADGLDAVVVAGDLTDSPGATQTQTGYARQLYESVLSPKSVPMIYTVGNHDANPSYWWTSETYSKAQVMRTVLGADYFLFDAEDSVPAEECRHSVVGGYHILSITPNGTNAVVYPFTVMNWLDRTLQALTEADPERFVFVNTHPMIENTCYGSLLGTPMGIAQSDIWSSSDSWATRGLTDILKKYPQVVTFGGHLHFPLHDPRSIWQGDFTSFGCGSVRYMAIENGKYQDMKSATVMNDCEQVSDGWLIQLDADGNMRATALDFLGQAIIGTPYEIPYPHTDKSHLAKYSSTARAAANQAPVLDADRLQLTTRQVGTSTSSTLQWDRASDDEFVHHYVLTVSKNGSQITEKKYLADFYLHPQPSQMKETWSVALGSLPAGTYDVKLVAYDSWDASCTCTKSFTVDGAQPIEKGLYADIDFKDGVARDSKGKVSITNKGATFASTTVSHGGRSYTVPAMQAGTGKYLQCQFNEFLSAAEMSAFMSEGFSIEAMFVDKAPGAGSNPIHGIFCGTQNGGWGLALRASGVPYFVVGEGSYNNYVILDASTTASKTELTHVVCVYDPSAKTMSVYVNGTARGSKSISGSFYPGAGVTCNRFCLGADISLTDTPDYPCTDMVITDAKFYSGALDAAAVQSAYTAAVQALNQ